MQACFLTTFAWFSPTFFCLSPAYFWFVSCVLFVCLLHIFSSCIRTFLPASACLSAAYFWPSHLGSRLLLSWGSGLNFPGLWTAPGCRPLQMGALVWGAAGGGGSQLFDGNTCNYSTINNTILLISSTSKNTIIFISSSASNTTILICVDQKFWSRVHLYICVFLAICLVGGEGVTRYSLIQISFDMSFLQQQKVQFKSEFIFGKYILRLTLCELHQPFVAMYQCFTLCAHLFFAHQHN